MPADRDPRIDPQPGDVVRSEGTTFYVRGRDVDPWGRSYPGIITYDEESDGHDGSWAGCMFPKTWRSVMYEAEIVERATMMAEISHPL